MLLKFHETIRDARRRRIWNEHLKSKIIANFQRNNAHCSSFNFHEIECSCVNDNSANHLQLNHDVNLIFVSSIIIVNWIKQTFRYLCDDSLLSKWRSRHEYNILKLNRYIFKISIEDKRILKRKDLFDNFLSYHKNVSTFVIITIKDCYQTHVLNVFVIIVTKHVNIKKTRQVKKMMFYAWDRICVNEAHQKQFATSETIFVFKNIDKHVRKWFMIETSFESSFNQITNWINTLQLSWECISSENSRFWERRNHYQRQREHCTVFAIKDLDKRYKTLINKKSKNAVQKIEHLTQINEHAQKLSIVLNTLWLRKDCEHFRFFNQSLTNVIFNFHHLMKCQFLQQYVSMINDALGNISKKIKQLHPIIVVNWEKFNKIKLRSEINVNDWLIRARRMRVLSTFSRLSTLSNTASLKFTNIENIDFVHNWVKMILNRLYELQSTNSSYEKHIEEICAFENPSKIKTIHDLITKEWDSKKKAMFCIMSSTNALILYWVNFILRKA